MSSYAAKNRGEVMLKSLHLCETHRWHVRQYRHLQFQPGRNLLIGANGIGILDMLRRRPCIARQIADIFGMHLNEIAKYTEHLLHKYCIQALQREGEIYYEVSSAGSPASTELENSPL